MSAARSVLPASLINRIELLRILRRTRQISQTAPPESRPNPLPAALIVSLTSFPPRFGVLHRTLNSLLAQSVRPDRIILWIATGDLPLLPPKVRGLESRGITVRVCEDIGSYKKLIYALEEYPDAFIATADDDMFYEPRWLEGLVAAVKLRETVVVCHRAHRIKFDESGKIAPYAMWEKKAQDAAARAPSADIVPIGCAGILYPPGALNSEVLDKKVFRELCPSADDLWFYWMARRAGTKIKKTSGTFPLIEWPNPRAERLWRSNMAGGNDMQIRNLEARFGNPIYGA